MRRQTVYKPERVKARLKRAVTKPIFSAYVVKVDVPKISVTAHYWLIRATRSKYSAVEHLDDATMFRRRIDAETALLVYTSGDAEAIGKTKVFKINLVPDRLRWVVRGVGKFVVRSS